MANTILEFRSSVFLSCFLRGHFSYLPTYIWFLESGVVSSSCSLTCRVVVLQCASKCDVMGVRETVQDKGKITPCKDTEE